MPHLLALDTSTEAMCIALVTPQAEHVLELPGGAQASARLIPETVALLARAGVTLAQLDAIAFGRGPGAFTGLRTACAVTQGLALGAGKPVLPIDSLMLVAEQACGAEGDADVWVAMDARMDEIYAGWFQVGVDGDVQPLGEEQVLAPDRLAPVPEASDGYVLVGNAWATYAARIATALPPAARVADAQVPDACHVAAIAARLGADAALAPECIEPAYVRNKVALTMAERARAAGERGRRR